jgi:hypothetical protein
MRFFDDDKVGCYLDDIGHRVEKTKDGNEIKMVDLTLRVQPLTPELAVSLDPDVRSLLFAMNSGEPKPKIKTLEFKLTVPRQQLNVYLLPESADPTLAFFDVEISGPRARTEKGVDGYGFVFYASVGPLGSRELEYVQDWHTQQRFVSFAPQQPALDFAGDKDEGKPLPPKPPARHRRQGPSEIPANLHSIDEARP